MTEIGSSCRQLVVASHFRSARQSPSPPLLLLLFAERLPDTRSSHRPCERRMDAIGRRKQTADRAEGLGAGQSNALTFGGARSVAGADMTDWDMVQRTMLATQTRWMMCELTRLSAIFALGSLLSVAAPAEDFPAAT